MFGPGQATHWRSLLIRVLVQFASALECADVMGGSGSGGTLGDHAVSKTARASTDFAVEEADTSWRENTRRDAAFHLLKRRVD